MKLLDLLFYNVACSKKLKTIYNQNKDKIPQYISESLEIELMPGHVYMCFGMICKEKSYNRLPKIEADFQKMLSIKSKVSSSNFSVADTTSVSLNNLDFSMSKPSKMFEPKE